MSDSYEMQIGVLKDEANNLKRDLVSALLAYEDLELSYNELQGKLASATKIIKIVAHNGVGFNDIIIDIFPERLTQEWIKQNTNMIG